MFLTKKSFRKILIMAICYFLLGSISISSWAVFNSMGINEDVLLILGIIAYLFCVLMSFWGRYAEGEGKLILRGGKLVQKKLKPAAFIKEYEELKHSDDLVINKPSIEVLTIVASAYDSLDDKVNTLKTMDEMIAVAGEKKIAYATILKASVLYSYKRTEEAEKLFLETQKMKLDLASTALVDVTLKSDRAMAMGDYEVAEAYYLKLLERKFPKLDNLVKLVAHYQLGEIYEKLGDNEKAVINYRYCMNNGGETAIKISAIEKLQHMN